MSSMVNKSKDCPFSTSKAEELRSAVDDPKFWLLVRRFCMAPEGERRDAAKKAVLEFVLECQPCQVPLRSHRRHALHDADDAPGREAEVTISRASAHNHKENT